MAEDLIIGSGTKKEQYEQLLPQIKALIAAETDLTANLANVAAALKEQFQWLWIGFYLVKNNELVVGPFQGPIACTRITKGHGICGLAWETKKSIIVENVNLHPNHIACSSRSQSEIVIPIIKDGIVKALLDADSEHLNHFDSVDQFYLEQISAMFRFG